MFMLFAHIEFPTAIRNALLHFSSGAAYPVPMSDFACQAVLMDGIFATNDVANETL